MCLPICGPLYTKIDRVMRFVDHLQAQFVPPEPSRILTQSNTSKVQIRLRCLIRKLLGLAVIHLQSKHIITHASSDLGSHPQDTRHESSHPFSCSRIRRSQEVQVLLLVRFPCFCVKACLGDRSGRLEGRERRVVCGSCEPTDGLPYFEN